MRCGVGLTDETRGVSPSALFWYPVLPLNMPVDEQEQKIIEARRHLLEGGGNLEDIADLLADMDGDDL